MKNAISLWHAEALEFGRRRNTWKELTPRDNPVSWAAWRNYFMRKFGRVPVVFGLVEKGQLKSWTAPIDNPASYEEMPLL